MPPSRTPISLPLKKPTLVSLKTNCPTTVLFLTFLSSYLKSLPTPTMCWVGMGRIFESVCLSGAYLCWWDRVMTHFFSFYSPDVHSKARFLLREFTARVDGCQKMHSQYHPLWSQPTFRLSELWWASHFLWPNIHILSKSCYFHIRELWRGIG